MQTIFSSAAAGPAVSEPGQAASPAIDDQPADAPIVVHRHRTSPTEAEIDIFDRARSIYLRGRRRYPRRAAGII